MATMGLARSASAVPVARHRARAAGLVSTLGGAVRSVPGHGHARSSLARRGLPPDSGQDITRRRAALRHARRPFALTNCVRHV